MSHALAIAEGRVSLPEDRALDLEDLTAVLNSDAEGVLVQGLARAARQMLDEHSHLLLPDEQEDSPESDDDSDSSSESAHDTDESSESEADAAPKTVSHKRKRVQSTAAAAGGASSSNGAPLGLLGAYLAASPDATELFVLWDLEQRRASHAVAAAHTDLLAAVTTCLTAAARTAEVPRGSSDAVAVLCKRLMRERLPDMTQQLEGSSGGACERATLRLLAALARSSRFVARDLSRQLPLGSKAFARLLSKTSASSKTAKQQQQSGRWQSDARYRSVQLLAALMGCGDTSVQQQLVAPAATSSGRSSASTLALVLRRPLVEDTPPTALAVLQLLQEHVLGNRRLPRHARAAFFGGSALDALRKAACDAPAAAVRTAALALLTTLLCDVEVSPFLSSADASTAAAASTAATAAGSTSAAATAGAAAVPKSVLRVLLQLPAHSDAALQSVLFAALQATPALVAPYLRGLTSAALEPKPGQKTLQMYSMLTALLRTAPLSVSGDAREGGPVLPPEALLAIVLPPALNKKELTKVR
jgi:hypothetical protein